MAGKLGLGVYANYQRAIDDVVASNATCCLLFADACARAAEIKQRASGMLVIGRDYRSDEEQWAMLALPEPQRSQTFWTWGRWLASTYPDVDVWQALNETYYPGGLERLRAVVAAEIAFTNGVASVGRRSCVLNAATGTYPVPGDPERAGEYVTFAREVKPLLEHPAVAFLGLHAYGSPRTQYMRDDAAWFALRYREFVRGLRACGVRVPPVVITEYGQPNGWRQFMNAEEAAADLAWFGSEIAKDDYVFGATYFLDGTIDAGKWGRFDILYTSVPVALARWNAANPVRVQQSVGGENVGFIEQYKAEYDAWAKAGGPEHHFKAHILATHPELKVTREDFATILGNISASVKQLELLLARLPFA